MTRAAGRWSAGAPAVLFIALGVLFLPASMRGEARSREDGLAASKRGQVRPREDGNWPQWRGPSSYGVSSESNLPTTWSASENIAWKAPLAGLGASSPIVWGDRVFVTSQIGRTLTAGGSHPQLARDDRALADREQPIGGGRDPTGGPDAASLVVEAFHWADGKRLWEYRIEATGPFSELHEKHNLATPTPITDGERVYAWFGNGRIVALDMDGRVLWTRHLGVEYSPFQARWGHGSSPALHGDLLILLCDHLPQSYLLALDKRTGRERWKADRGRGRVSHSTPIVVAASGGDELLVNSSERIDAYDPTNGALLWYADSPRQTPIPSAVFHDGRIYMSRGYRNSDYMAIRPGGRGDVTTSHIEWRVPGGASYVPSLVYYDGLLYMTNEVGVVTCADAKTGERLWRQRLGGVFFASPVAGDGKIYMVSETGETFVMRAGREPEVLAQNDLGERFIASPAVSNGRLFLRGDGTLFAVTSGSPSIKNQRRDHRGTRRGRPDFAGSDLYLPLDALAQRANMPCEILRVPGALSVCPSACSAWISAMSALDVRPSQRPRGITTRGPLRRVAPAPAIRRPPDR